MDTDGNDLDMLLADRKDDFDLIENPFSPSMYCLESPSLRPEPVAIPPLLTDLAVPFFAGGQVQEELPALPLKGDGVFPPTFIGQKLVIPCETVPSNSPPYKTFHSDDSASQNSDASASVSAYGSNRSRKAAPDCVPRSPTQSIASQKRRKRPAQIATVPDEALDADQLAKRQRRRERNKESAQMSRQRKKQYLDDLTQTITVLTAEKNMLQSQMRELISENEVLKRTLHANGIAIPAPARQAGQMFSTGVGSRAGMALFSLAMVAMFVINPLGESGIGAVGGSTGPSSGRSLQVFRELDPVATVSQMNQVHSVAVDEVSPFIRLIPQRVQEERENRAVVVRPPPPLQNLTELFSAPNMSQMFSNATENVDMSVLLKAALESLPPSVRVVHRFGSLFPWEALEFIKANRKQRTEFIFCSEAHSIQIHEDAPPVGQPKGSTDGLSEFVSTDSSLAVFSSPEVADDLQKVSFLLPSGVFGASDGGARMAVMGELDELSCRSQVNVTHHSLDHPSSLSIPL